MQISWVTPEIKDFLKDLAEVQDHKYEIKFNTMN
jgi:hypothetical protein